MNDQSALFDTDDRKPWQRSSIPSALEGPGQARWTDPATSKIAAQLIRARATSARVVLLVAFYRHRETSGLTDEQAAVDAGLALTSEYATRCSELRRAGFLEVTGDTRRGRSGAFRDVSRITPLGVAIVLQREALR